MGRLPDTRPPTRPNRPVARYPFSGEPRKIIEDAFDAMAEIDGWTVSGWILRNANVVRAFMNEERA